MDFGNFPRRCDPTLAPSTLRSGHITLQAPMTRTVETDYVRTGGHTVNRLYLGAATAL